MIKINFITIIIIQLKRTFFQAAIQAGLTSEVRKRFRCVPLLMPTNEQTFHLSTICPPLVRKSAGTKKNHVQLF